MTLIQNELKNAYIWWYDWTPNANTLLYLEFNNNLNDSSGNSRNATNSWSISYISNPSAVTLSQSSYLYVNNMPNFAYDRTFNCWVKRTWTSSWNSSHLLTQWSPSAIKELFIGIYNTWYIQLETYAGMSSYTWGTIQMNLNEWYNISVTYNYTTKKWRTYVNWDLDNSWIDTTTYAINWNTAYIWAFAWYPNDTNYRLKGNVSKYIVENKEWSSTDVKMYFHQTKWNYWL